MSATLKLNSTSRIKSDVGKMKKKKVPKYNIIRMKVWTRAKEKVHPITTSPLFAPTKKKKGKKRQSVTHPLEGGLVYNGGHVCETLLLLAAIRAMA